LIEECIEDTIDEPSIEDPLKACFAQFGEDLDLDLDLDLDTLLEQADAILEYALLVSSKNEENIDEPNIEDPLEAFFAQFGEDLDLDKLLEQTDAILESAPLVNSEKENEEAAIPEPPKKELTPLQDILKYKFLGPENVLPLSLALDLLDAHEEKLPDVSREHKEDNGWTIDNSKWVSDMQILLASTRVVCNIVHASVRSYP
jgi:hypothetical protein